MDSSSNGHFKNRGQDISGLIAEVLFGPVITLPTGDLGYTRHLGFS